MIKVLFICHGNICRSPMAEFIMKDKVKKLGLEDSFEIASAATSSEEIWNGVGNPVYPAAKDELKKHGIACAGKRARQMVKSDYDNYDYLIGMDDANIRNMKNLFGEGEKIFKLLSFAGSDESVSDPWYTDRFDTAYKDINKGIDGFFEFLEDRNVIN
ncbi:low molecular weight protein-tyrosine-phosphatase [Lachnoanaerobaculum umeaense]|uniref:protein-tyrosine-phosphatase n=1 Tax=Lachnoanaerobaculum umeaense TaxID=617123 RepID=A0A385Q219_9FIRM|nr:low molecular weight protein-tyrosine-phosphatase [Lachnoanaerobaculum umeaense]AYB00383.1 low molecular weight phosphotyrosine protein phosphatase [Lachnoanaerobaculum umeaense]PZW99853.1 protein-tyrosine phosphatase [Lachnoanaerobaculum umeaense]